jgi:hypothetical protein
MIRTLTGIAPPCWKGLDSGRHELEGLMLRISSPVGTVRTHPLALTSCSWERQKSNQEVRAEIGGGGEACADAR